jgi:hypothetical protein
VFRLDELICRSREAEKNYKVQIAHQAKKITYRDLTSYSSDEAKNMTTLEADLTRLL